MGIFDAAKDQAGKLAEQHPDKVEQLSDQGIERAGDMVDQRTGGQFAGQVDSVQEQADQRIGDGNLPAGAEAAERLAVESAPAETTIGEGSADAEKLDSAGPTGSMVDSGMPDQA